MLQTPCKLVIIAPSNLLIYVKLIKIKIKINKAVRNLQTGMWKIEKPENYDGKNTPLKNSKLILVFVIFKLG